MLFEPIRKEFRQPVRQPQHRIAGAQCSRIARGIPVGYGTLSLVYLALALVMAWILRRFSRVPLDPLDEDAPGARDAG